MKKLKFLAISLFAALTCIGFTSCSDSDDETPEEYSLVGSWGEYENNKWVDVIFTFKENGSGYMMEDPYRADFLYNYNDPILTIVYESGWKNTYTIVWKDKNTIRAISSDDDFDYEYIWERQ